MHLTHVYSSLTKLFWSNPILTWPCPTSHNGTIKIIYIQLWAHLHIIVVCILPLHGWMCMYTCWRKLYISNCICMSVAWHLCTPSAVTIFLQPLLVCTEVHEPPWQNTALTPVHYMYAHATFIVYSYHNYTSDVTWVQNFQIKSF